MGTQKFVQMAPVKLSGGGITSTATTIGVQTFQDPGGDDVTTSLIGTTAYATLEPGTSREEIISFTGVTHSSTDDTATLTGVTRNLDYVSPYTQISATGFAHAGGTLVVVSNNPQLYENFASTANTETINEVWTFNTGDWPKMSDSSTSPTADEELATKGYADSLTMGGAVSKNATILSGTAGATVADGDCVYLDETANEWLLADGSATGTCDNLLLGVAQGAGTDGNAITGGVLLSGRDDAQSGFSAGDPVFISDTGGTLASTAGTVSVQVGQAISATEIDFSPTYYKTVATALEKAAMAGTSGTVGSGNLYVTELGLQRSIESYAVDSVGTDSYAITLDPVPAGYVAGMTIKVLFGTANTGAATIDVNTLGAKAITKNGAVALADNDIKANQVSVLVYDGTQFQLQAVASDLTVANAATLVGGGDTTLHDHAGRPGLNVGGTTYAYTLVMDNAQWTLTDCVVGTGVAGYTRIDSNAATWEFYGTLPNANDDADSALNWDQTKTITAEWRAQAIGTAGDKHMGFNTAGGFSAAYTGTARKVCFATDGATLFAVTADNATNNNTDISAGITVTNWHTYKIVWTPGTNALFYVDGNLLATETDNLPSGTNPSIFGFGGETNAEEWNIAGIHIIQTI